MTIKTSCEELQQVFYHIPKCRMKILLEDFDVKLGRGNFFKLKIGSESLYQVSNDNGVGTMNCDTPKYLIAKGKISLRRNIHK